MSDELLLWLPAVAAAIAVGSFLVKRFWPWICAKVCNMVGFSSIHRELAVVQKQLRAIKQEFEPNSGESMRDGMNRVERTTELALARQRLRDVDSNDMLLECDEDGNCIYVNRTIARAFGRVPTELYNHGWVNIVSANQRDNFMAAWEACLADERAFETEFTGVHTNGESFPCRIKSDSIENYNGRVIGYLATVTFIGDG